MAKRERMAICLISPRKIEPDGQKEASSAQSVQMLREGHVCFMGIPATPEIITVTGFNTPCGKSEQ
jgi:hypothetical protein